MLLLLPLDQKPHKNHLPWVTALLVLINVFVYAAFQTNDDAEYQAAAEHYVKSGLMSIERPLYLDYLKSSQRKEDKDMIKAFEHANVDDEDASFWLWQVIQFDPKFQTQLDTLSQKLSEQQREQWHELRPAYLNVLSQVTTLRFGFIPARHDALNMLTHQFMHGSWGHLFGNMLFLILVGYAVEMYLGSLRFTLYYLIGGAGAVGLFWALDPHSTVPLVGASGAIAGVMGMYAGLYGLRKIRFFYWFLFFFNYIKAPALIMLPLWIAKEAFGMAIADDNVAYSAHLGGLITGSALGLLSHWGVFKVRSRYIETVDQEQAHEQTIKDARAAITSLDFDTAERLYRQLHAAEPKNFDFTLNLFNLIKRKPLSDEFHLVAKEIFDHPLTDLSSTKSKRQVFLVYKEKTQGTFKMPGATLVSLAATLAKGGAYKESEWLLSVLYNKPEFKSRLAAPLLLLAQSLAKHHHSDKAQKLLKRVVHDFPDSAEAQEAKLLLRKSASAGQ